MGDDTDNQGAKSSEGEVPDTSTSPIVDDNSNGDLLHSELFVKHTLPFKVMGSAHNLKYQRHLERAYDVWNSGKGSLLVLLCAEKENQYDPNAIAVLLKYGETGFHRVGYIAKELTQYILPHINTSNIHLAVKKISFRVDFSIVGYYLTIDITKKGEWDSVVVRASKKVK